MTTENEGGMAYIRNPEDLREALAKLQHEIWSHWMRYQFSCCFPYEAAETRPGLHIPGDKVERWQRQTDQHYDVLSEKERESDREQADKILALLLTPELLPALEALVLKSRKLNAPFDLQGELDRLRMASGITLVVNESRRLWRVEELRAREGCFTAMTLFGDEEQVDRFDLAQVSDHDLQFLSVGAEFWVVSAQESGLGYAHVERMVFVPTKDKKNKAVL